MLFEILKLEFFPYNYYKNIQLASSIANKEDS